MRFTICLQKYEYLILGLDVSFYHDNYSKEEMVK